MQIGTDRMAGAHTLAMQTGVAALDAPKASPGSSAKSCTFARAVLAGLVLCFSAGTDTAIAQSVGIRETLTYLTSQGRWVGPCGVRFCNLSVEFRSCDVVLIDMPPVQYLLPLTAVDRSRLKIWQRTSDSTVWALELHAYPGRSFTYSDGGGGRYEFTLFSRLPEYLATRVQRAFLHALDLCGARGSAEAGDDPFAGGNRPPPYAVTHARAGQLKLARAFRARGKPWFGGFAVRYRSAGMSSRSSSQFSGYSVRSSVT